MLGTFGFSYVGFIYLLMLLIPNIIWAKNKTLNYSPLGENGVLLMFERIGQVIVTCAVLIFKDFNIANKGWWTIWLILSFNLMVFYEICWIRYFIKPSLKRFYGSFLKIPCALATLPVLSFIILGIYGKVIWLIAAAFIFGVGHIGIHIQHKKQIR